MAKAKATKTVVKCVCSLCGQVSSVINPGATHYGCVGVAPSFFEKAPKLRGRFRGKDRGTWTPVQNQRDLGALSGMFE